jgi:hypothetical protein
MDSFVCWLMLGGSILFRRGGLLILFGSCLLFSPARLTNQKGQHIQHTSSTPPLLYNGRSYLIDPAKMEELRNFLFWRDIQKRELIRIKSVTGWNYLILAGG